jgi:LmbE family N-acetylglucosaminyl deacetylase
VRILIVVAHPDDIDFACGGSVARWAGEGHEVSYCILTDGDAGGFDESVGRTDMAQLRRKEQRAAADVLGAHEIDWLGWPDGRLYVTHDLRRDISRSIRRHRPERVIVQSPVRALTNMYGSHPDHTAAGEAAMCAIYPDARNPFAHPELLADEGLEAWTVSEVWLGASPRADHAVDVTDVAELKFAALKAHVSQVGHRDDVEQFVTGWMAQVARTSGMPAGALAEAFHVVFTD